MKACFVQLLWRVDNFSVFSGTSLLQLPTGLGKSDLNLKVTVLQGASVSFFELWNTIWD